LFGLLEGPSSGWVDAVKAMLLALLMLAGVWRFGVLALMIAFLVQEALPDAVTLLQVSGGGYRAGGALLLLLTAAPAFLAWIAYRRCAAFPTGTGEQRSNRAA